MTSQLFMKADEPVGVPRAMQRLEPFQIGVPFAKPPLTILINHLQLRIFENLQRQAGMPGHRLEMQLSRFVLRQVLNRKVTKTQLPSGVFTRENEGLMLASSTNPDDVRQDSSFSDQWLD